MKGAPLAALWILGKARWVSCASKTQVGAFQMLTGHGALLPRQRVHPPPLLPEDQPWVHALSHYQLAAGGSMMSATGELTGPATQLCKHHHPTTCLSPSTASTTA